MFVFLCLSCVPISSCQADEWETFACSVCSVNLISSQTNAEQVFVRMRLGQARMYMEIEVEYCVTRHLRTVLFAILLKYLLGYNKLCQFLGCLNL